MYSVMDIKELLNESREKYGTRAQGVEMTLSMGKVFRVINFVKAKVEEAAEALVPEPQPTPVPVKRRYR